MFIPNGFTEEEVLRVIEEVVSKLASPFKFGFYEVDDMKQEGRIFAIQALPSFDAARGTLKVFLMKHVRNRFINLKRNKLERLHAPCSYCPFNGKAYENCCGFANQDDCDKWQAWKSRNTTKKNLMEGYNPNSVSESIGDDSNPSDTASLLTNMSNQEIVNYVDKNVPVSIRADYCRLLSGCKLSKGRRERVLSVVRQLVHDRFGDE